MALNDAIPKIEHVSGAWELTLNPAQFDGKLDKIRILHDGGVIVLFTDGHVHIIDAASALRTVDRLGQITVQAVPAIRTEPGPCYGPDCDHVSHRDTTKETV